jgi:predicted P-loop ATPase
MWLTAAVKRVYSDEPVQFDYVLMLEGKTGTYKTSFFEALGMHGTEGRHFCNALEKQYINNPRSFALNMLGKLICYDGDLKVLQDIRSSDIKGFITRTYDTFDNKYDRMQTTVNRQFVIAADTNETAFLDDVTGNRRYIVIHIDKGCPYFHSANWRKVVTDDGLTGCNYIYQLWAEAVHSYKADPEQRLDLSDEAKELQKGVNELYSNEGIEAFYDDIVIEAAKLYNKTHNVRLTDMQKTLGRPKSEGIDGGILERFTGKQQIEIIKKCLAKAGYKRQTKRLDSGKFTKVLAPVGMPDEIDIPDYSYNKALETDENWLD